MKIVLLVCLELYFFGENRFALSILVIEKIGVKFWIRIRPIFNIYAADIMVC